jgi:predicted DNA-binding transcriptional regulator YafY
LAEGLCIFGTPLGKDMAKKRRTPAQSKTTITAKRAARFYRMLSLVSQKPQTRAALTRRLKISVRDFYRDLVDLRDVGIEVALRNRCYVLMEDAASAQQRLPFPDPGLNLGEALQLAKGRSRAHRKLKEQIAQIMVK